MAHYQLSATASKTEGSLGESSKDFVTDKSSRTYNIETSIFNMEPEKKRLVKQGLKIHQERIHPKQDGIVGFKVAGSNYEMTLLGTEPAMYSLLTSPTSIKLNAKDNGLAEESRLYVINKIWCCKELTLDIILTAEKRRLPLIRRASEDGCPWYGVPICFQYAKYPVKDCQLDIRVSCDLVEGRKATWLKKQPFPAFDGVPFPDAICEVTIGVPYVSEMPHYQLSATATKTERSLVESSKSFTRDKSSRTYSIETSIFNMEPEKKRLVKQGLKIHRGSIYPKGDEVVGFKVAGSNYRMAFLGTEPAMYSLLTSPTSMKLSPKDNGLAKENRLYVINKMWCCKELSLEIWTADKRQFLLVRRASQNGCPWYGVPICFQYAKYPVKDCQLDTRVSCDIFEGRKATWLKKQPFPAFDDMPFPDATCDDVSRTDSSFSSFSWE